MGRLEEKRVLITGGTSGIGLASAELFLREGARVAITGQNEQRVREAGAKLGPNALAIRADVASRTDMEKAVAETVESFSGLEVVFANAGIAPVAPLGAMDDAHVSSLLDVNIRGVINTLEAALPHLDASASILITSSTGAAKAMPNQSLYGATKAAVRALARSFSAELAPRGIRVNVLSPGLTDTPILGKIGIPEEARDEVLGQFIESIPAKRMARAEEMAEAALYLASDASAYMLGGDLVLDGGYAQL